MRALRAFLLRISGLFRKQQRDRDLADELESHLQLHTEDNIRAGMSAQDARRDALLKLGGIEAVKENYREQRSLAALESLSQDLRYAIRTLRKNTGFAAVAVLTLALGIGANTAMYSIVHAVMLRPLPVSHPEGLVRIYETNASRGFLNYPASILNYQSWKQQVQSLELAAFISVSRNWTGEEDPQRLEAIAASSTFLSVLGTSVHLGRWFAEEEQRPGQHQVVVLSDGFWRRQFGQDSAVIGRKLVLEGEPYTIVGVARPELVIPSAPDVWVPLLALPQITDPNANRGNRFIQVTGRLKTGFTLQQARAEMFSLTHELERQFPGPNKDWSTTIVPLLDSLIPLDIRTALIVLLAAFGTVMLIACANVANLQLARSEARRKEIAIRAALGAGVARIARQLLTESVLLSLTGGAVGIALANGIIGVARQYLADIVPRIDEVSLDLNVLAFALGVSIVTGILFGLAPLVQLRNMQSLDALHQAGRTSQTVPGARLRALLVIAQVSLATLLLTGAGLLIQSFARLQEVSLGMDPDPVLTAQIPLPSQKYARGAAYSALLSRLTDALESAPGVRAAGVSSAIPLGPGAHMKGTAAAIAPSDDSVGHLMNCDWRPADAGFFSALRIPLLRGRVFNREDGSRGRSVFVLSQETARNLFGDDDPIGRQVRVNDSIGEVIGVVGDIRMRSLSSPPDRVIYVPLPQGGFFGVFSIFVRTDGRPEAAAVLIKERLREIDPNLPAYGFRPMRDWVESSSVRPRIRTWVLSLLSAVALALGTIGIYGVLAYLVTLRRQEFGVRLALGAQPGSLLRLVVTQGLGMALVGIAAGLGAAMLLASVLDTLLFGVSARDPLTFLGVAMLLLLASLIACYVPARRAARADPLVALRSE